MSLGVDHVRLRGKGEQAVRGDRADIACGDHPQGDLGGQEGRQVVEDALAEYRPNPAHRRAKLLCLTPHGRAALDRIRPGHAAFAEALTANLGFDEFRRIADALDLLSEALDHPQMSHPSTSRTVAASENGTEP